MSSTEYSDGQLLFGGNDALDTISLIADGEVEGVFGSHKFLLGKSDVIGVFDNLVEKRFITYTATSNVSLYNYPCKGMSNLDALIQSSNDIAYLMVNGLCKQVAEVFVYCDYLKKESSTLLALIEDTYNTYLRLCGEYSIPAKRMPDITELEPLSIENPIKSWVHDFYVEVGTLEPASRKAFFYGNPGIELGFLQRCKNDIMLVVEICELYHDYLKDISKFLLSDDGFDLFGLTCELHLNTLQIDGADSTVEALINSISDTLSTSSVINSYTYNNRLYSYWDALEEKRSGKSLSDESETTSFHAAQPCTNVLAGSVDVILDYAEADDELRNVFAKNIRAFTEFTDRNSSDDEVYDTRRDLTKAFYAVYKLVLKKSLEDAAVPTIINMFLNFGFVDPTLAGMDNANFLYSISDSYKGAPEKGIYTIREWLTAIYRGEKEPSLSEFDMDYQAFLRDQKNTKQIDAKEEARLLKDQDEKLRYEMENAFPVVNRVTFGNPTRFCPVFSDHNILRDLEKTLLTAPVIEDIINNIRNIDFSAFYRETGFSDQKLGITNESINVEILPNIILMPNVGQRGSMWQEIEGRIRTTPARMFLPIFLENDFVPVITKLVAEFRWEMCKRTQGARWNDMTDPSLTSYFCDYLQFYMNNRSLAMQTMTEIRNELSVARNNYKTVFVSNYLYWIQNESKGMARLNNVALGILMTFCPFTAAIREQVKNNMRYNDALTKYNAKKQKRTQRLTLLVKRLTQNGKKVPKVILEELEFSRR